MAVDKRVAAGGAAAVLLGFIVLSSGGEAEAAEEPAKPKRPLSDKEKAVILAVKFARLFGIPTSLVLAVMAVGGWRPRGYVKNNRGGAWGYMFMTLATAQDLTKRFPAEAKKYWPGFNGTGESLYNPATNIALGAWQLRLQWRRFNRWIVAALSYYTGAGRMDKLLQSGGGRLPATLPADVAKEYAAYKRVRASDPYVKKAIANDGPTAVLGAGSAAEPRKRTGTLANAKVFAERFITRDQCRAALGEAAKTLAKAYPIADKTPFIAAWAGLRKALHERIDAVNTFAVKVYKAVDAGGDPPTEKLRVQTALAVLQANDALADVDEAVNDPELQFLPNFLAAIKQILEGLGKAAKSIMPSWAPAAGIALVGGTALYIAAKRA